MLVDFASKFSPSEINSSGLIPEILIASSVRNGKVSQHPKTKKN